MRDVYLEYDPPNLKYGLQEDKEYNPDVMDNGLNLAKQKLCPEEKHIDQDA